MYLLLACLSPQYDYIPKTLGGGRMEGKKYYRWTYLLATAIAFSLFYTYSE